VNLKTKSLIRVPEKVARSFPSRPARNFAPNWKSSAGGSGRRIGSGVPGVRALFGLDGNGHVNNTTYF